MRIAIVTMAAMGLAAALLLPEDLAGQTVDPGATEAASERCVDQLRSLEIDDLSIESRSGRRHRFNVYLAISRAQRGKGLMCVKDMPADMGMLFWYQEPRAVSMWMKNTYIPLDMLFVTGDGRVLNIAENTEPHSLESVAAVGVVSAVIELNAGTVSRLRIQAGDIVVHPIFNSGEESEFR